MKEIRLYNGLWKPLNRVMLFAILLTACFYVHYTLAVNWPLWVGTIVFVIPLLVNLFYALDRRPQIILSKSGIYDKAVHNGVMSWQVIKEAYAVSVYGRRFICIAVDDNFKPANDKGNIYKRLALFSKSLGARELHLSLRQINADEEKLAAFIVQMKAASDMEREQMLSSGLPF